MCVLWFPLYLCLVSRRLHVFPACSCVSWYGKLNMRTSTSQPKFDSNHIYFHYSHIIRICIFVRSSVKSCRDSSSTRGISKVNNCVAATGGTPQLLGSPDFRTGKRKRLGTSSCCTSRCRSSCSNDGWWQLRFAGSLSAKRAADGGKQKQHQKALLVLLV